MQIKQTNSAITFMLSEYRAIFRSAYVKGLTAAVAAAAPVVSAQAAWTAPDASPDNSNNGLDLSASNFDGNIGAQNAAASSAAEMQPLAFNNGSTLSYVDNTYPASAVTATYSADSSNATSVDTTGTAASAAADNSRAATGVVMVNKDDPKATYISNWNADHVKNAGSEVKMVLYKDPGADNTQYFYYQPGSHANKSTFANNGTISYDWEQQRDEHPYSNMHENQAVVVAGAQVGSPEEHLSNNGTINLNGYDNLDNVALKLEGAAADNTKVRATLYNRPTGTINVTNGTGMKIEANGTADLKENIYVAGNDGNINVTVKDDLPLTQEDGTLVTDPHLTAAGIRFTGPTNGYAHRTINNKGTINVKTDPASISGSTAYGAGIVVDGGADDVVVNQSGIINVSDGNYAIYVGNDSPDGVTDATSNTQINLGPNSQINGEVRLNHQTTLNMSAGNQDGFVLTTYSEQLQDSDPSAPATAMGNGIALKMAGGNSLTLEKGSDATVDTFFDAYSKESNTLQVSDGASLKFTKNASGKNINLTKTRLVNHGENYIQDGATINANDRISNFGTINVTDGSTLNVSGGSLENITANGKTPVINVNASNVAVKDGNFNNDGELNLDGSALNIDNPSQMLNGSHGVINAQNGSTITANNVTSWGNRGTINLDNSTLTSQAPLDADGTNASGFTNSGNINLQSGSDATFGVDQFGNSGTIRVNGSELTVTGELNADGTTDTATYQGYKGGSLELDNGKFNLTGRIANQGTIRGTSGSTVTIDHTSNPNVASQNYGTIEMDGSTLDVKNGSFYNTNTAGAQIVGKNGSTLNFTNTAFTNDGSISLDASELNVSAPDANGSIQNKGQGNIVAHNGSTATFNADSFGNSGIITSQSGSTINLYDNEAAAGGNSWDDVTGTNTGSNLHNAGVIGAADGGTVNIAYDNINNNPNGTISASGTNGTTGTDGATGTGSVVNIKVHNMGNSGVMDAQSGGTIDLSLNQSLTNQGQLNAHDGTINIHYQDTTDSAATAKFLNNKGGTVNVAGAAGALNIDQMVTTNKGTINADSGAHITVTGADNNGSRVDFQNEGDLALNNQSVLDLTGMLYNQGKIRADSGSTVNINQNFASRGMTNDGSIALDNSTMNVSGGTFNNGTTGNITAANSAALNLNVDRFNNQGRINIDQSQMNVSGTTLNKGDITAANGSTLNFDGSRFDNSGNIAVNDSALNVSVGADSPVTNLETGVISVNGAAANATITSDNMSNFGTVNVTSGGQITFQENKDVSGSRFNNIGDIIANNGTVNIAADTVTNYDTGSFEINQGTLDIAADGLSNQGIIKGTAGSTISLHESTGANTSVMGNKGSITADNSTINIAYDSVTNYENSEIAVNQGTLDLTADNLSNRSTIKGTAGSTISLHENTGTTGSQFKNTSSVTADNSNINIAYDSVTNYDTGEIAVNQGTLDLTADKVSNLGTIKGTSGSTLSLHESTGATGSQLGNRGSITSDSGDINIAYDSVTNYDTGEIAVNQGKLDIIANTLSNQGTIKGTAGSTINIHDDGSGMAPLDGDNSVDSTMRNTGTITSDNGSINIAYDSLTNYETGTIAANQGNIDITSDNLSNRGTINTSGGQISLKGSQDAAGTRMDNIGTITAESGNISIAHDTLNNLGTGNITTNQGNIDIVADNLSNLGNITNTSGTITLKDKLSAGVTPLNGKATGSRLSNNGNITAENGNIDIAYNLVTNGASGTISVNQGNLDIAANDISNQGTITVTSGSANLRVNNTLSNSGELNADSSTLNIGSYDESAAVPARFINGGKVNLTSGSTANINATIDNKGTITADNSNLNISGPDFANWTGATVELTNNSTAQVDSNASNNGNINVQSGSTAAFTGDLVNQNGTINITDNGKVLAAGDKFSNKGTININQGTLGFRADSVTAAQNGQAVAKLSDLGTINATDATFELLESPATYSDPDNPERTLQAVVNVLEAGTMDDLGSGSKVKLNNNTAVNLTGENAVSNDYFASRFESDTTAEFSDPEFRNVYLSADKVTYTADSGNQIAGVQNAITNFRNLDLARNPAATQADNTVSLADGSNIVVSNSLTSATDGTGYDTLAVNGSSQLTLDTNKRAPGAQEPLGINTGTVGLNLNIAGADALLQVAGSADAASANHWVQDAGKTVSLQSGGRMNVGENASFTTDSLSLDDTSRADLAYTSSLKVRGDSKTDTVDLSNNGTINNLGTVDLSYGDDTIGVQVNTDGTITHQMGNAIDGGGHIIVDLGNVQDLESRSDWNDLNDFAQNISNNNGNVEIRGVENLRLPESGVDPDTGYNTISREDIENIFNSGNTYPDANLNFETKQTKNAVLTGINNTDGKLFGGGWRGVMAEGNSTVIGTNDGSHTNIYGDADGTGHNIAVNELGERVRVELGQDSTLNVLSNGKIGAVTGNGTFQVTGDNGAGQGGNVSVLDNTDDSRFADVTSTRLVAVNGAQITAQNYVTQGTVENSTVTAMNDLSFTSGSKVTYGQLNARHDLSVGDGSTIDHSTFDADNNLALGRNNTVANSTFNVDHNMTMGAGSTFDRSTITAESGLIAGPDSLITAGGTDPLTAGDSADGTAGGTGTDPVVGNKTTFDNNSVLSFARELNIGKTDSATGAIYGAEAEFTGNTSVTAQTLNINGSQVDVIGNSQIKADTLNIDSGSTLRVGRDPAATADTGADGAVYANADTGRIDVGTLNSLAGSRISLDPSQDQAAAMLNAQTLADGTLRGAVAVGRNSVMGVGFGSSDVLSENLSNEKITNGNGSIKTEYGAVLALNEAIKLDGTASISVDGNGTHSDAAAPGNSITLKNNGTLLMTDQAFSDKGAAITFTDTNKGQVVSNGGQIHLAGDFNGVDTYNLFDNGDVSQAGDLKLVSANGMISGTIDENGDFKLTFNDSSEPSDPSNPTVPSQPVEPSTPSVPDGGSNGGIGGGDGADNGIGSSDNGTGGADGGTAGSGADGSLDWTDIIDPNNPDGGDTGTGDGTGTDNGDGSDTGTGDGSDTGTGDNSADGNGGTGGNNGSAHTYKRVYINASVPVDHMIQDAFNSKERSSGNSYLREVAMNGMGKGIEAERAARMAVVAGAVHSTIAANDAIVNAVDGRQDIAANVGKTVTEGKSAMWVAPMVRNIKNDGFSSQGISYGADVDLSGVVGGIEHAIDNNITAGAAVMIATGTAEGNGVGSNLNNNFDSVGGAIYLKYQSENLRVGGDVVFSQTDSDFSGYSGMGDFGMLSGSTKDKVWSFGVNGAYTFLNDGIQLDAHAGVRYSTYKFDNYSVKSAQGTIAEIQPGSINLLSIPVGVLIKRDIITGSWKITPSLDLTLTANMGDTDLNMNTVFGTITGNLTSEVIDDFTYGATVGVQATNGNFSFGVNGNYTGSSNSDEYVIMLNGQYQF